MNKYLIETITNEEEFLKLKSHWNELVFKDSDSTIFQLWEWNYAVWGHVDKYQGQLCILKITSFDGSLVGIVPLCLKIKRFFFSKIRILGFIGDQYLDYKSPVIDDAHKENISEKIGEWLFKRTIEWDIIDLNHISADINQKDWLKHLLINSKFKVKIEKDGESPFLVLDKKEEVFDNVKDTDFEKYLKRKLRKIKRDFTWQFNTTQELEELKQVFPVFIQLNKIRSRDKLQKGAFRSENRIKMFSHLCNLLLEKGMLKLYVLLLNEEPVAALLNFVFKNKTYFYQSGFDVTFRKYSVGHIIHYFAIEDALKNGNTEYDFLNGDESYKKQWTSNSREMYKIKIISSKLKNLFIDLIEKLNGMIYDIEILKKIYFIFIEPKKDAGV